jgi:hypothetical protein
MKGRETLLEVAQIASSGGGLTFHCRPVDGALWASSTYRLQRTHPKFQETFELLLDSLSKGLVVKVTTDGETYIGEMVTSVSLHGGGEDGRIRQ